MVTTHYTPRPRGSPLGARRAAWFTGLTSRKVLLACGGVGPIWWVVWDVVSSLRYPGYSYRDQTISELSAQGAPTRTFMMLTPYAELMVAFGVGIWLAARASRAGCITAALLVGGALWGFVGGLAFPMATREVMAAHQEAPRNQMHFWYGVGMPIFFVPVIDFGSRLLGQRFRSYSYATILAVLVAGVVMGQQVRAMAANEPTPWMGVEERITAYLPKLWYVVLALGLVRVEATEVPRQPAQPMVTAQRAQEIPR